MNSLMSSRSIVDRLVSFAPENLQQWLQHQRNLRGRRKRGRLNAAAVEQGERLVPERELEAMYRDALTVLAERNGGPASLGDYLEFGVYNGSSLACMYRALTATGTQHIRLFGFDSFEGLPDQARDDDEGAWYPGQFSMDYEFTRRFLSEQGVDWGRVHLVKGWFTDTLTSSLLQEHGISKASIIMVDCDMYSSAKEALTFCAPLIQDSAAVFFDDWNSFDLAQRNMGEKRAFDEFLAENPLFRIEDFGQYNENSQVFIITRDQG